MNDAQWLDLVTKGRGTVITRFEGWHNGISRKLPKIIGGEAQFDLKALQSTATFELDARSIRALPTTPGVTEIWPYRGIEWRGERKLWPLGRFRISSDQLARVRAGKTSTVSGADISRVLTLNKLSEPMPIMMGFPVEEAVRKLLSSALSGLQFVFPSESIGATAAMLYDEGTEPWPAACKLVASYGCRLEIDRLNRPTIVVPQTLDTANVRTYTARDLLEIQISQSDDPGYNGIKFVSEPTDGPSYSAYALDDDPLSETYYRGPYGPRIRTYKSKFPMTELQVQLAARRLYPETVGLTSEARFKTFVDPSLQIGQVLALKEPSTGVDGRHVAESFNIPFDVEGDMEVITTKRRNGLIAADLTDEVAA